jgi:sortase A
MGRRVHLDPPDEARGSPSAALPARAAPIRWLSRSLTLAGGILLGLGALAVADGRLYAARQEARLAALFGQWLGGEASRPGERARREAEVSGLVGRIEIPRVGISSILAEGRDPRTLRRAVGHLPGTAFPGEAGNAVFAGHRDLAFRGLRDIRPGDDVLVTSPDGVFQYRVDSTEVVAPDRVEVLAPTRRPTLTLITCFPFGFLGPAPQRLIVRAELVGPAA